MVSAVKCEPITAVRPKGLKFLNENVMGATGTSNPPRERSLPAL